MTKNERTSAVIDGLLKFIVGGGLLTTALIAPNAIQALDKPLAKYLDELDERSRQREYRRLLRYMKQQGLIKYTSKDYEHGILLTESGKQRAQKADLDSLLIPRPTKWDHKWRIVMFDIPESHKRQRDYLSMRLKELGFVPLQKSVWIHPYPCRKEVAAIVEQYDVRRFVTYIETNYIDAEELLKDRFSFKI